MKQPRHRHPIHRSDRPTFVFLGVVMRILLSSEDSGGQFSMIEGIMPPGGDGGLHIHAREDGSMTLIEGRLKVTIGDTIFILEAGQSYFAPRGIPQRLRNLGNTPARGVLVTTPGGFDHFIVAAGTRIAGGAFLPPLMPLSREEIDRLLLLAADHGIHIIEPPALDR